MRKRFAWVALAQLLPLLAICDGCVSMARAADGCQSGPGRLSPSGSHWYYSIDRATKRKCWFLGPLGQRTRASMARSSRRAVASMARSSRRVVAAPVTPPPERNAPRRDPNAESAGETTLQPKLVTSSTLAGLRRAPIVARDQGSDDPSTANEMPLVWPAPASAASNSAAGKTTVAAADSSVAAPASTVAAPAPVVATPAPALAANDPAPPARPLAATTVAAEAAPVASPAVAASAAAAPVSAAAPAPAAAPTGAPTAPAAQSFVSWIKLFFIFAFIASSLAFVSFLGRGLIDYEIARRTNRRAAERARTEAAWKAAPSPPMPYMHAPHLADNFEPTPERPVQDQDGDSPLIARHSAMCGRVA